MVLNSIVQAEALGLASEPADVCYRCVLKGDDCSAVRLLNRSGVVFFLLFLLKCFSVAVCLPVCLSQGCSRASDDGLA